MWNARVYRFAGSLDEGLKTGKPQNEIKAGEDLFAAIYENPDTLRQFLSAMTGHSVPSALAIAQNFPWAQYKTFADIGTAQGCLAVQVAQANPHLIGVGFDLSAVRPFFEEYIASFNLQDRLGFCAGDFFKEPLPCADVLVMGMILHDWSLDGKRALLKKAHDALPDGGALIVYEHLIDDERRNNSGRPAYQSDHASRDSGGLRLHWRRLLRLDARSWVQRDPRRPAHRRRADGGWNQVNVNAV